MYTEKDKQIAKAIVENAPMVELLAKVLLAEEDKLSAELISSKTNDELGEFVRANYLAETKIKLRFDRLKRLASEIKEEGTKKSKVPS